MIRELIGCACFAAIMLFSAYAFVAVIDRVMG